MPSKNPPCNVMFRLADSVGYGMRCLLSLQVSLLFADVPIPVRVRRRRFVRRVGVDASWFRFAALRWLLKSFLLPGSTTATVAKRVVAMNLLDDFLH